MMAQKENAAEDWSPMAAAFGKKRRPAANRVAAVLAPQDRACGHRGQRAVTDPPFPAKGFLPCCARR